jgi:hypothetical protein
MGPKGRNLNIRICAVRPVGRDMGSKCSITIAELINIKFTSGAVDAADLEDEPDGSQGFCLLNNVAIGAAYAKCNYRSSINRVAVIDFDVHHGNGTEAIVSEEMMYNVTTERRRS